MLTLKQLRYFEALSRLHHFGRAARECAISQPALSMKIQELEATLGLPLVERRRNGVRLTSAGDEIARRARSILTSVRDLSDYARNAAGTLSGGLVLGAIPSIAPYLLPAALPLVRARHPALELTLRETQTSILIGELLAGELDTILLSLPVEHAEIATLALFTDRFVLAARSDASFDRSKPITPEILSRENLLLLEDGHCLRDQALNLCQSARAMRDRFGASSLATLVQLVANGYGVTLLPEMAVPIEVSNDDRIALYRFAEPQPSRSIGLAWRRTSPQAADFMALGEIITEVAAPLPELTATRSPALV
ncbi:MAG: LysR family transcriptional regulator [Hyphomicrobiales bacterium]|nr:LysR family transcriptional regulator [Hyphomicrobiales bacterium]MBV9975717.1 LysR family transcriptional regulator [Hyphomicrobiales bacterium]